MTENDPNFSLHAGYVIFPRSSEELASTALCPACHEALAGPICVFCALDLNHPAAHELAAISTQAASLLDRRKFLIGQMRFQTAAALAEQAAARESAARQQLAHAANIAAPAVVAPPRAPVLPPAESLPSAPPVQPLRPAPAPRTAKPEPTTPRRSSIQVLLLIVGISLLSVAAVFFLVYAFINYGLIWRSAIIGSITVAAFVVASVLRRRQYTGTAEGIGAFAVVLVYLDAFAVKANDLFGLGSADNLAYWGTTLIISAVLFVAWHRLTTLRVGSIAGFSVFAPGLGLLVAGVTNALDTPTRVWAALLAVGLAGLVHPLAVARPRSESRSVQAPERIIALSIASVGLLGSLVASFFVAPESFWAPAIALGLTALVALAHLVIVFRSTGDDTLLASFAVPLGAFAAVAAAVAMAATLTRQPSAPFAIIAPAVGAAVIAASIDVLTHRTLSGHPRMLLAARASRLSALAVTGLALIVPVTAALLFTAEVVARGLFTDNWSLLPTDRVAQADEFQSSAIVALTVVLLLALAASAASGVVRDRRAALAWPVLLLPLLAVPLLGVLWVMVAAWFALSGAALALLLAMGRQQRPAGTRRFQTAPLVAVAAVGAVLAYLTAWGSTSAWHFAALATIALLLVARAAVRAGRALLLAVAIVVLFVAALSAGSYFDLTRTVEYSVIVLDALRLLGIAATLVAAAAAIPALPAVSTADRRTMFWMSAPLAFGAGLATWLMLGDPARQQSALLPEFGSSAATSLGLLLALILWTAARANRSFVAERAAASIFLAPVAWWMLDSLTRLLAPRDLDLHLAPATAVVAVSAAALLGTALARPLGTAWARDLGIALVAVPALAAAVLRPTDTTWLVFVMAGVAALLLAISNDGLFGSRSPRKHLGWLALALATAGLWWRLTGDEIVDLEAFVLPVAGALLLVALLVWRAARRDGESSRTAPLIALAGLLIAVLPLSLNAVDAEPVRLLVLSGLSSLTLIAGSVVRVREAIRPYADALATGGAAGTVILFVGHSIVLGQGQPDVAWQLDLWLAAGLVVLLVASCGQGLVWSARPSRVRRFAAEALGIAAIGTVLLAEISGFDSEQLGTARAWAAVILFCVFFVVAAIVRRAPFTVLLGRTSLCFAVVAACAALISGALGPFEIAIIAAALASVSAVPQLGLAVNDRRLLFWLGSGVALLSGFIGWRLGLDDVGSASDRVLSLSAAVALLLALVLWAAVQKHPAVRLERIAASSAVAPAAFLVVDSASRLLRLADSAVQLAPVTSALLVAAAALTVSLRRPAAVPRWAFELGIAVVAVPATAIAMIDSGQVTWLVLVLAGATALLSGITAEGLFGSTSGRKHLGWVALALATAGLWWRLAGDEITAIELYVLPLGGALLLVALLVWRSAKTPDRASNAAPLIALGGLVVAVLPIALNAATGPLERALALGLSCAALALVASLVRGTPLLRPYLDVAALAGVLGVLVLTVERSYFALPALGSPDVTVDVWLGAAFVVLAVVAFGQSRPRLGESHPARLVISQILALIGLTVVLGFEIVSFGDYGVGQVRALAVLLLFSIVHVVAVAVNRVPLGRVLGWVAFGYAALTAIVGTAQGALDPIEVASVPLALALFGTGVIHLSRTPASRSWLTLGPGMLLLLVPSLIVTFDEAPLWRLVALGVVAVAAIIVGLVRQLQAPFIIGVVIALVHGFRTFVPQLQNAYQATEWWVWAGIGGIVLVVLAARYEKSVRTLRTTITRIGQLR